MLVWAMGSPFVGKARTIASETLVGEECLVGSGRKSGGKVEAAAGGIAGPVWACGIGMLGPAAAGPASLTASLRQDGMYEKIEDDALLAAWFFARSPDRFMSDPTFGCSTSLRCGAPRGRSQARGNTHRNSCWSDDIYPRSGPVATHARTATSELAEVEACAALLSCCWHSGGR